jgi:TonB family protein
MLPRIGRVLAALISFGVASVVAQDFSVTPLSWLYESDNPDVLPDHGSPKIADLPEKVEKLERPTFARVRELIGEDGAPLSRNVISEFPWLEPAARTAFVSERHPKPALRSGKPVVSEVEYFLVFNPANAPKRGRTVAARLLQPATVAWSSDGPAHEHLFVEFEFSVDAEGHATALKPVQDKVDAGLLATAREELGRWRFAPARSEGRPVASTVVVPVLFVAEPAAETAEVDLLPQVFYQPLPQYPVRARQYGVPGSVTLSAVVDVEGRVRDVEVVKSSHRVFEEAALSAMKNWRFSPARKSGVPVLSRIVQPFGFQIADGEPSALLRVKKEPKKLAKLPPELRWDEPPEYSEINTAVYPYEALASGKEGTVQLVFIVGPQGRITESRTISASDPAFAGAALAMLETFRFTPASKGGKPCNALISLEVKFSRHDNALVPYEHEMIGMVRRLEKARDSFAHSGDLDRRLTPRSRPVAVFPSRVGDAKTGEATIEFVVDRDGVVQVPRIVSATAPAFGYAAAQAVASLRFNPPRKNGKPVDVIARLPMVFKSHE